MDEKIIKLIESLGNDGIQAFYIYLAVDYISAWVVIGLIAVGVMAVWKKVKENL